MRLFIVPLCTLALLMLVTLFFSYGGHHWSDKRSLATVLNESRTDKFSSHGYHRFYDVHFAPLRNAPIRLLEVGADRGASMNAWSTYFTHPEARIYGVAYKAQPNGSHKTDHRVAILYGDQNNCSFLSTIAAETGGGELDLIIDDGSHHPNHQLRTLEMLFQLLKPGGLYVVEDIETSYWDAQNASVYGYSLKGVGAHSNLSFVEFSVALIDVINRRYAIPKSQYQADYYAISPRFDPHVESVSFGQNVIIFKRKTTPSFDKPFRNLSDGHSARQWSESSFSRSLVENARRALCDST